MSIRFQPLIIGSGMSGQACAQAFAILSARKGVGPALEIGPAKFLDRGVSLRAARADVENENTRALLIVANPHGLHANLLIEAVEAGFRDIVCEKPACVNADQLRALRGLDARVAILHGYRMNWGPQTIRKMIETGECGQIIAVEGKYWQASAAAAVLADGKPSASLVWKNDPKLSGSYDTLLDIGTHWADLSCFLIGEVPSRVKGWKSYVNAQAPHRDTHLHMTMEFPGGARATGSISKTVHGATNELEIIVVGEIKSLRWNFMSPDEIIVGHGRDRTVIVRQVKNMGTGLPGFHGAGWIEGYVEVVREFLNEMSGGSKGLYPTLNENLDMLESLFKTVWS